MIPQMSVGISSNVRPRITPGIHAAIYLGIFLLILPEFTLRIPSRILAEVSS